MPTKPPSGKPPIKLDKEAVADAEHIPNARLIRVVPGMAHVYACEHCGAPFRVRIHPSRKKGIEIAQRFFKMHMEFQHS